MTIRAGCPGCGASLKAEDRFAGRTIPCPRCGTSIELPQSAPEEPLDPFAAEAEEAFHPKPKASPAPVRPASSTPRTSDRVSAGKPKPSPPDASPPIPPVAEDSFLPDAEDESIDEESNESFPNLTDADLAGEAISPRKKKKKRPAVEAEEVTASRSVRRPLSSSDHGTERGWRYHLHWLLLLALIPLGISIVQGDEPTLEQRITESLQNHPEVNEESIRSVQSVHDLGMMFPDHRIDGALLPADTYLHWAFAAISAGLFFTLFLVMWPRAESVGGGMLGSGLATGTIGIVLLLGFQWIAFATRGVMLRGRGVVILLFLIVKFIGFSYICALDEDNGFAVSFFGFTFGVGLCEELCKALPVVICVVGNPDRSLRSVCLIGLASGVGFGVSEGITYSSDYYNGLSGGMIYLIRFASCVALHSIWAGAVSILIYRNRDHLEWSWEGCFGFVFHYLFLAMMLHGLYDTLLKKDHHALAFATAIGSFLWFHILLMRTAANE